MAEKELKAGEYVVTADVLTLRKGTAEKPDYERHRKGAVVKLTAEEADKFGSGKGGRALVRAKTTTDDEQPTTQGAEESKGDVKATKSKAS